MTERKIHAMHRLYGTCGVMRCPIVWADIEPDDYCSFGKRRECGKDACDIE